MPPTGQPQYYQAQNPNQRWPQPPAPPQPRWPGQGATPQAQPMQKPAQAPTPPLTQQQIQALKEKEEREMARRAMGQQYDAASALNAARKEQSFRTAVQQGMDPTLQQSRIAYDHILEYVQNKISTSEEYNRVLSKAMDASGAAKNTEQEQLKSIIYTLLQKYPTPIDAALIEQFLVRIYDDMTGIGILTPFLADPDVEEINVFGPGPHQIEIVSGSKGGYMLDEGFKTAQDVLNVTKRMVRQGNMVIDASNPRVDSYMASGVRVSAMIPPIIRDDKGAVLSIRKQTKARITKNALIETSTAMAEEFNLIELCVRNNISGAIVGATGSGKTTLLNYLLNDYAETSSGKARIYIIEESRELQLPPDAKVFYTAVTNQVSAQDLLKSALRFHPTFISCAEMRGEEAMNAMNAAQTGHVVWSTFHADNCEEAYTRLLTMCKMSNTDLSESLLMRNLASAFPLIISSQQLRDGTRKITGIYEADGVEDGRVVGHYIYKMQISKYERDEAGRIIRIHGRHAKVGYISDAMAQRIFDNCGLLDEVKQFARPDWMPESMVNGEQNEVVGQVEGF